MLMTSPDLLVGQHLRKLNFDLMTSFEPICYLVNVPTVIAVNSASPYRTLSDLLSAARAKPGELTLASIGPGTAFQIAIESLKRAAKVDTTFIPYPGGAPVLNASTMAEQLKAGKLRALATASRTRIEPLPEVPTIAESGYKDYEMDYWYGVLASARTPKNAISQLADLFIAALKAPEVKGKLVAQALYPVGICGEDFAGLLRKQYDAYGRAIREANIKAQ